MVKEWHTLYTCITICLFKVRQVSLSPLQGKNMVQHDSVKQQYSKIVQYYGIYKPLLETIVIHYKLLMWFWHLTTVINLIVQAFTKCLVFLHY